MRYLFRWAHLPRYFGLSGISALLREGPPHALRWRGYLRRSGNPGELPTPAL